MLPFYKDFFFLESSINSSPESLPVSNGEPGGDGTLFLKASKIYNLNAIPVDNYPLYFNACQILIYHLLRFVYCSEFLGIIQNGDRQASNQNSLFFLPFSLPLIMASCHVVSQMDTNQSITLIKMSKFILPYCEMNTLTLTQM